MQFHLNGFRPGDPAEKTIASLGSGQRLPREVDVLIVGCGPAGLVLAAQLAAFPDISVCIVEQKSGPLQIGQADGVACRTMEMFEAFGFAERVVKEAYWVNETTFWKPDEVDPNRIMRHGRIQDTEDGLSEFPHVILNQARVHDFLLQAMRHAPLGIEPHYGVRFIDIEIASFAEGNSPSHPVTVRLERVDGDPRRKVEIVKSRYVVGCDGARSAVRKALGRNLTGDSANQAWGVMDVLAVTDFPDIRLKAAIHSAEEGSMLIIPREGGYLVRFYIELDKLAENERVSARAITADRLVAAARRIIRPYSLEVKEIAWWSVYEIGQRLCDGFDDVAPGEDRRPRVFIAGDACHTHSPKAGQGMNVSMGDAFNIGWKLAAVVRGQASPRLLDTYSNERHAVAKELIDFDREFARMFSARPKTGAEDQDDAVDPAAFQRYFVKQGRFTAGTAVCYEPSLIRGDEGHQALASGFPLGMRLHSAPVLRLADAKPVELGHCVKADGRWRLIAFADAGEPFDAGSNLVRLCHFLDADEASPVRRHTPPGQDVDAVIEMLAVLQQNHREVDMTRVPAFLRPAKGRYGLWDYEKLFCADTRSVRDIFDLRGIRRDSGCMVVVRPDQYVAAILPLTDTAALSGFFASFMLEPAEARLTT
ncbi:FAD-binding monooxygenase [Bosea sp. 47.2.35]|uniref:FAD-binding monooxygenase n=1 Tax=Bosea sp. 47.2.35 TaxID=2969304 RepID=UPI0021505396|nr:FAD-binding monooxygenase [Bosea sp. 47.2.35]MCR4524173.1 FAD-binding monooxygenase [Bosea sp. 47.2.35]